MDDFVEIVKKDWQNLKYIEDQTPEICMAAVDQNSKALTHVEEKTRKIYLKEIQKDDREFIKNTPEYPSMLA